ncbi:L-histidine N(alpha)-methyltransferase [Stenotrophomonas sp. 24(2023)]|uniref:L-histidine N(alpha)-methyltransferase n=1 Tax=Stenotrophomonas sp. 24(2023) TaxID=3068324 RepID=UPI0027E07DC8|nr:L-histidine N(alpha)-methyltransferase [Stenotrophomonas sp. 24(2023)]WMJ71432.1 L-histidine N(alpha)-methyltransferase [Stenotrophomonas sp. 24(2023)]
MLQGLSATPKALPPKYFYDAEGSRLFEAICRTPEYYLTRTELALLQATASDIASHIAPDSVLVEFGSGASLKTRVLLDATSHLRAYVPIDISAAALADATATLQQHYPALAIEPQVADFSTATALPALARQRARLGFFPGSTLGNFPPGEAVALLAHLRHLLGSGAQLLVGADLVKDSRTLQAAYDDAAGVTAAFNRNLLARINRELGADIDPEAFLHRARWNPAESRMEMWLVSQRAQTVHLHGHAFPFAQGEGLHTEHSYKFTPQRLAAIAECAGWQMKRHWLDHAQPFGLFLLSAA